MRLRFLDMAGARCASTVGLSSGAVLGDGVVVRGSGARGRPGLPADSHASRGAGAVVPRLLVQACEVATCCWAVCFRGAARCVSRRRAPRALFVSGRAVLKSKRVCARGPRGRPRVVGWTKNEYIAALYGGNAASLRAPRWKAGELFWLVALTLHNRRKAVL